MTELPTKSDVSKELLDVVTNVRNVAETLDCILLKMMTKLETIDSLTKEAQEARSAALLVCPSFDLLMHSTLYTHFLGTERSDRSFHNVMGSVQSFYQARLQDCSKNLYEEAIEHSLRGSESG